MSNELTLREAALAWAQGKRVEARPSFRNGGPWNTISRVGAKDSSGWPASILNEAEAYEFRIATEPTAKKFRPWTPEEVPVGALIRFAPVVSSHCWMITGWNLASFFTSNNAMGPVLFEEAESKGCQHSMDNGKTWLPCGVEVEA